MTPELVILSILKIIGFVLLGVLALALIIILVALFLPITYEIYVSKYDEFKYKIKILFITVISSDKPKKEKEKHKKKKNKEDEEKKPFLEQIKELYHVVKTIYEELTRPANSYTLGQLSKKLVKIVKSYGPRRLDCNVDFGMDDPSITGMIAGAISVFPLVYTDHVNVRPDFNTDNNFFRGYASLKGHIQLCVAVGAIFSLLGDKVVRKNVIRILKKISKEH